MDTMTIVIGLLLAGLVVMAIMKYMSNMEGFQGLTNMFSRQSSSARQISSVGQSSSTGQSSSAGQSLPPSMSPTQRKQLIRQELTRLYESSGCTTKSYLNELMKIGESIIDKRLEGRAGKLAIDNAANGFIRTIDRNITAEEKKKMNQRSQTNIKTIQDKINKLQQCRSFVSTVKNMI